MEMLSEHTLEGWLEGYLLTGRHGFFSTYESFVHVIDSMVNEHCKWLEISHTTVVARSHLLAQSINLPPRFGGRITMVLRIGIRAFWISYSIRVLKSSEFIFLRMLIVCCRLLITACAAPTTSM